MRLKYIVFVIMSIAICSCFQKDGKDYYDEGIVYHRTGDYKEAIEIFTEGISMNDEYANLNYLGRGMAYRKLEEFDLADQDLQKVLETEKTNSDKTNRDAYWELAWIAQGRREKDKELEFYKKALEYDPDMEPIRMTYGLVLIENGSFQEGVDVLGELINENYDHPYVFSNRALGYIKLKKYGQASKDLKKSLEMDEENPFVYKNFALLYSETNQLDLACKHINKALSLNIMDYGVRKHILEFEALKSKFCL